MLESPRIAFPQTEQSCLAELNTNDVATTARLWDALDGAEELTDAQWLRRYRQQFRMSQSNIVSYLEITTWQNVNPGRIAEIETGQRCLCTLWRSKLERLFNQLQNANPQNRNWREFIRGNEDH